MNLFKGNQIYLFLCFVFIIVGSYFIFKGFYHHIENFDVIDVIIKKINLYKDSVTLFFSSFFIGLILRRYRLLTYRILSLTFLIVLFFSNNLSFIPICLFFVLTCFSLTTLLRRFFNIPKNEYFLNFYLGYVFLSILLTFFSFFPINNALFYLSIFTPIIIFTFKENVSLYQLCLNKIINKEPKAFSISHLLILALLSIYLFVSLMPEQGHDALVHHLYFAAYVKNFGLWGYNFHDYVWALFPQSADQTISFFYMFGDEISSRLSLFLFLLIFITTFYKILVELNLKNKSLGILLLLTCPVLFLISTSLYIDIYWASSLLMIIYVVIRAYKQNLNNFELYLVAFTALSLTIKFITALYIFSGILVFLIYAKKSYIIKFLGKVFSSPKNYIFIIFALFPYIYSYFRTKNPVFPFFNKFFQSEYFSIDNFTNSMYHYNDFYKILYDITFHSYKFIEGGLGSFGFIWLFLFLPMTFFYLHKTKSNRIFVIIYLFCIVSIFSIFYFQSYLRYIFLVYPLFTVLIIRFYNVENNTISKQKYFYKKLLSFLIVLTIILNTLHLNSATHYGLLDFETIFNNNGQKFRQFEDTFISWKSSTNKINEYDSNPNKRILYISPSQAGNLKGHALYLNWHNNNNLQNFIDSINKNNFNQFLKDNKIDYVILWKPFLDSPTFSNIKLEKNEMLSIIEKELRILDPDDPFAYIVR